MVVDDEIKSLIMKRASADELMKAALKNGMKSLRDDGLDKVKEKITSKEEVFRVTQE